jgi:flavorubredoxin
MAQQGKKKESGMVTISPMERLTMRVSSMINHPIAQERREVRIHRLDTDGEREWSEIVSAILEADGIDLTHNHEDASITLRWEPSEDDEKPAMVADPFDAEEPAPF